MKTLSLLLLLSVPVGVYGSASKDSGNEALKAFVKSDAELFQEARELFGTVMTEEQLQVFGQSIPVFRKMIQDNPSKIRVEGLSVRFGDDVIQLDKYLGYKPSVVESKPAPKNVLERALAKMQAEQEEKEVMLSRILGLLFGLLVKEESKEQRDPKSDESAKSAEDSQPASAANILENAGKSSFTKKI